MREDNWYKWFFIAMLIHALIIGAFSVPVKGRHKKIDLSSYYSVNLVGDLGGEAGKTVPAEVPKPAPTPPAKVESKKAKPVPEPKSTPVSPKTRTLAPVKKPVPETTEKDDVRRLDKRIREMQGGETTSIDEKIRQMRKQVQYMDVAAGAGKGQGSGVASSGSVPLDPALAQYFNAIKERLMSAWRTPYSAKKDLETLVTITVRRDGRITDWQIDHRSGNRAYDEAVSRTLRSIDKLPPIPASLNQDSIDVPFRFLPFQDAR